MIYLKMKKNNIYCLIAAMALTACATDNDITSQAYLADDDNAVSIASATRGAIATADAPVKSFHLINTTQRDMYNTKYECGFMLDGDTYKPINGKVMWYNEADDNGQMTAKELVNMVKEVNATQVEPADQLTDHVYHYDSQNHIFELADKYEERQREAEHEAVDKDSVLGDLKEKKQEIAKKDPAKDAATKAATKKHETSL